MSATFTTMYARMCNAKGDPSGVQKFYCIVPTPEYKPLPSQWNGPFRDATDAENAAMDEAKAMGVELEWLY